MTTRWNLAVLALSLSAVAGCSTSEPVADDDPVASAAQAVEACPSGTYAGPDGRCVPCLPGGICLPVIVGFTFATPIESFWTPTESPPPAPPACGANADRVEGACLCVPGYYAPKGGGDCAACPVGADCSKPGTTEEGMRAASGWFRGPGGGFHRCAVPEQCP